MCYDLEEGYKRRIKEGIRMGASKEDINHHIDLYNQRFPETPIPRLHGGYHLSGFTHPALPVFVKSPEHGLELRPIQWGLIPHWCNDAKVATSLWNQTLNARSESMFEKPSFRTSAQSKRGIVMLQSYYEHHHFGKRSYPFNIRSKDDGPLFVAVLWDEWEDATTSDVHTTFGIVTVPANDMLAVLHNNPKAENARMPLILDKDAIDAWLDTHADMPKEAILELCRPYDARALLAYPVRPLRGARAVGDVPEAVAPTEYPELVFDQELMEALGEQ